MQSSITEATENTTDTHLSLNSYTQAVSEGKVVGSSKLSSSKSNGTLCFWNLESKKFS